MVSEMKNLNNNANRPTMVVLILEHIIAFLFFIVFPGFVTLLAPASWLSIECKQEKVSFTAKTCIFFVIPFKTQHIDEVSNISEFERPSGTRKINKVGKDKVVHVDGEGFLRVHGVGDQYAEVSVSPASLNGVVSKCQDILNNKKDVKTTFFTIANWKFGFLMGGILTLFTVLYVVGYSYGAIKLVFTVLGKIIKGNKSEVLS